MKSDEEKTNKIFVYLANLVSLNVLATIIGTMVPNLPPFMLVPLPVLILQYGSPVLAFLLMKTSVNSERLLKASIFGFLIMIIAMIPGRYLIFAIENAWFNLIARIALCAAIIFAGHRAARMYDKKYPEGVIG